jgi:uncharacterized beta-barrel protein YwiB (DUF1934 family)
MKESREELIETVQKGEWFVKQQKMAIRLHETHLLQKPKYGL